MHYRSRLPAPFIAPTLVATAATLLLIGAIAVSAQSGRRLPNTKPVTAPPAAEPTPAPAKAAEKEKSLLPLVVGIDHASGFENIPLYYYGTALRGCAERLDDSPSVKVEVAHREMNRAEAVARAKAEKEGYVVWLQLRTDSMSADRNVHNLEEIHLEYVLFAPATAKVVTSGRTYQRAYGKGPVVVGPTGSGRNNALYGEYFVKQAARDAAARVLSALHLSSGRTTLP